MRFPWYACSCLLVKLFPSFWPISETVHVVLARALFLPTRVSVFLRICLKTSLPNPLTNHHGSFTA